MQDFNTAVPNRNHKDRLFRFIFHDKKSLLSLYNAINNSDYSDPEMLQIYTMEDFVYMGMKNDLAFLIDCNLGLFEHQSSYNPNMPLRGFLYLAAAYKKYIDRNQLDIYSSKQVELPVPRYYVFYNGLKELPAEQIMHLTDAMPGENPSKNSCIELTAHMININAGYNSEIMEKCPLLYQYATFVFRIRENQKSGMDFKDAIEKTVNICIKEGILADILGGNRAEVTDILLSEYDEAFHISKEKEISFEEGVQAERENTERERKRADEEAQRADTEAQRADAAEQFIKDQAQIFRLKLKGKSNEEIAALLQIPLDEVLRIIEN